MKIGTMAFLVVAVIVVNPELQMPAFSPFTDGGGPIIPGQLYPLAFITIACVRSPASRAIASGTTPNMTDRESDIRLIGSAPMLIEGMSAPSVIAATAVFPGD